MTDSLRRRSLISFFVFGLGMAAFVAGFFILRAQPLVQGTPKPFREVMELNGKIWKKFEKASRQNFAEPPPKGKIPRVNGDVGLAKQVDPATWKMEVIADDADPEARPVFVTLKEIMKLPRTDTALNFRCIEGWSEDMAFAGVKFSDFMKAYNLKGKAYVGLTTVDGKYYVSIDIESMLHDQTLLAYEMNGLPLKHGNGAPLRLVIPNKYGIKNLKQIGKIFFSDTRPPDYWAEIGYDWYAGL